LVDILHLLVRGNPGPILRAVDSKSDRMCVPCRRAPFFGHFCFYGGKKPSPLKLDFLLNSASVLPTLCVKASAQKALRAKVQRCFKRKGFFKVCIAGIELATTRPKRIQALCLPLEPTHYTYGVSGCNFSRVKCADFKSIYNYCKIGSKLLTPAVL
jgi:hypothetical protein